MRVSFWEAVSPAFFIAIGIVIGAIVCFIISIKKKIPYPSRFWLIISVLYTMVHVYAEKMQFESPYYYENYGDSVSTFYITLLLFDVVCIIIAFLGTFFIKKPVWWSICTIIACVLVLFQGGVFTIILNIIVEILFVINSRKEKAVGNNAVETVPKNTFKTVHEIPDDITDTVSKLEANLSSPISADNSVYEQEPVNNPKKTVFCGYCGFENQRDDDFCGKCGKPLIK